jgi:acyl-[acyl-carrier-protein]-phospholipid O-acyltransferase/long-chain-fatty-acid--[acyl-carrier-protein] ligase
MSAPDFSLLAKRRFGPLFVVQFLGAFNDNVLKFAMLFSRPSRSTPRDPAAGGLLALIATGMFILPYFLFSALAGQLADSMGQGEAGAHRSSGRDRHHGDGLAGFWTKSVPLLLTALF